MSESGEIQLGGGSDDNDLKPSTLVLARCNTLLERKETE